ncbi:MAG: DISARM system phospholipase D-like protein DrmC [Chloroflexales bacterium]
MSDAHDELSLAIARLVGEAAPETVHTLAATIARLDWSTHRHARSALLSTTVPAQLRARATAILDAWQPVSGDLSPAALAAALRAAVATASQLRAEQHLEVLWSGPVVPSVALRRTDQALIEVIEAAQQRLLLVSFAVHPTPAIIAALEAALSQGVMLTMIVERYEADGSLMAYDTIQALGDIAQRSTIYLWPQATRPVDATGRMGLMHVKCALADRRMLFLSSANLTGAAMNRNMELGVMISGGEIPQRVGAQFDQMIARGVLRQV